MPDEIKKEEPKKEQVIFQAVLTPDNKIDIKSYSNHIPSLSYIMMVLQSHIIELITMNKIKDEIKNAPRIEVPGNGAGRHNIIDFIRGKKK